MSKLKLIPSTTSFLTGGSGKQPEAFTVVRFPTDTSALNQSEITFIRKLLVLAEEAVDDHKQELTEYREVLWKQCDKDNPDTLDEFEEMNRIKDAVRKMRKDKKTIANIFTKLKRQSKVQ